MYKSKLLPPNTETVQGYALKITALYIQHSDIYLVLPDGCCDDLITVRKILQGNNRKV
jgi:hypothetical protein